MTHTRLGDLVLSSYVLRLCYTTIPPHQGQITICSSVNILIMSIEFELKKNVSPMLSKPRDSLRGGGMVGHAHGEANH